MGTATSRILGIGVPRKGGCEILLGDGRTVTGPSTGNLVAISVGHKSLLRLLWGVSYFT